MIDLVEKISNFRKIRVLVLGDLILDSFCVGDSERISPEAPIPVVLIQDVKYVPGGAGNTAVNLASLGAEVSLISLIGKDLAGERLIGLLDSHGISTKNVISKNIVTIEKSRIIARGQQIVRLDRELQFTYSKKEEQKIINLAADLIPNHDIVIFSDYAKGFFTKRISEQIIKNVLAAGKLVIADIKPQNKTFFKNISYITPNFSEAVQISGQSDLIRAGKKIQKILNCNILLTDGANGMTLFQDVNNYHIPGKKIDVYDIVGAGDTVTAVFALGLASNLKPLDAAKLSNIAGALVVAKAGTAFINQDELIKKISQYQVRA